MARSILYVPPRTDTPAREAWARSIGTRFAPIASALGLVFVLVVVGENLAAEGSGVRDALFIASWAIWLVFLGEFALRAVIAPSQSEFWKRNWWQIVFLALPFLRFIAVLRSVRVARAGRIVGSAVRGARSAGQVLGRRILWIATVHAIVVLALSQILFEFGGDGRTYGYVLQAVALAAVTGEPLGMQSALAQVLEVILAMYAVAVFATAAGVLGAFFLEDRAGAREGAHRSEADP